MSGIVDFVRVLEERLGRRFATTFLVITALALISSSISAIWYFARPAVSYVVDLVPELGSSAPTPTFQAVVIALCYSILLLSALLMLVSLAYVGYSMLKTISSDIADDIRQWRRKRDLTR